MADYMDDSGGDTGASATQDQAQPPQEDQGEQTALIDKNVFPDPPSPGDICKFRVVRVHDDEVELEYVSETDEEEGSEPPGSPDEAEGTESDGMMD